VKTIIGHFSDRHGESKEKKASKKQNIERNILFFLLLPATRKRINERQINNMDDICKYKKEKRN